MSTPGGRRARRRTLKRQRILRELTMAGRELSDAAVMYHTALAGRLGLGPSDWKMLGLLERHGALTAGELSARSGLAPPTVTGILERLEGAGWIRRARDPADRRRVVVELDAASFGADVGDVFAGLTRRLEQLYERYTDDQLELLLDFMREVAGRQLEATGELSGGG